jgi:hypothetical protein
LLPPQLVMAQFKTNTIKKLPSIVGQRRSMHLEPAKE